MATAVDETTDLLQHLIRNACVNDGTVASGNEIRTVDTLAAHLQQPGVEMRRYEPQPGRASLVLRIAGTDRSAPSLHLMGHADVVPASPAGWTHDPFGGELVEGIVWGRGAIDMLDVTASMAVAVRRLLADGFRPKGTLIYSAVADEEALGTWGAKWLVDNAWDDVRSDFMVTEFGGARLPVRGARGPKLPACVGEKGSQWTRLRVRGTPGHGSMPYRSDNAVVKAAEVVRRIAAYKPPLRLGDLWRRFVGALDLPAVQRLALTNAATLDLALRRAPLGVARTFTAATRTTFSPNIVHGGVKINIIPDSAEIDIDIRTVPGDEGAKVHDLLRDAVGDLWGACEIVGEGDNPATVSPMDTRLWDILSRVTKALVPGASLVPSLLFAATDARFFRRKGVVAYGYGLKSERIAFDDFARMFHGDNERVDQESLGLCVELWERTAREFCGSA